MTEAAKSLLASAVNELSVKETTVPEVAVEVTVKAPSVPTPVILLKDPAVRSPFTTPPKVGRPAALPCKTVVVVPGAVEKSPAEELSTTPAALKAELVILVEAEIVVNAPLEAVTEPMAPGAAKVAPFRELALRLATLVVDETVKGAVPVATVDWKVLWLVRPPPSYTAMPLDSPLLVGL